MQGKVGHTSLDTAETLEGENRENCPTCMKYKRNHRSGGLGVAGSNPVAPTIKKEAHLGLFFNVRCQCSGFGPASKR